MKLIQTSMTTLTTVPVGSNVPVGSIIRRLGNTMQASGTTVTISEAGYYLVDVSASFTGTVGNAQLTVYQNGNAISGATSVDTIGTAATEYRSASIATTIRVYCNAGATLSVGVPATSTSIPNVNYMSIRVVKV